MSKTLSEPTEGALGHVSDEDRVHTLVDQHLLYAPIQELLAITGEERVSHHTLDMAYVVLRNWYSTIHDH
jgi:hypothetical protein